MLGGEVEGNPVLMLLGLLRQLGSFGLRLLLKRGLIGLGLLLSLCGPWRALRLLRGRRAGIGEKLIHGLLTGLLAKPGDRPIDVLQVDDGA